VDLALAKEAGTTPVIAQRSNGRYFVRATLQCDGAEADLGLNRN